MHSPFDSLPFDLVVRGIFPCLEAKDLFHVFCTCKKWASVSNDELMWKQMVEIRFPSHFVIPSDSKKESKGNRNLSRKALPEHKFYYTPFLGCKSWKWIYQIKVPKKDDPQFTGKGSKTTSSLSYEGEWKVGQMSGRGALQWAGADRYEGDLEEGVPHGEGAYLWPDGEMYVGSWENGKRNGQGTYYWTSGNVFTGMWKSNVRSGQGSLKYWTGDTYEGSWEYSKKEGFGTYAWFNGNKLSGIWKADYVCGEGKFEENSGHSFAGQFNMDIPQDAPACLNPAIRDAIEKKLCTFTATSNNKFFGQVYYPSVEEDKQRRHGICVTCYQICLPRNKSNYHVDTTPLFSGNFLCDCGMNYLSKYQCCALNKSENP